jgi:hypothetical protein
MKKWNSFWNVLPLHLVKTAIFICILLYLYACRNCENTTPPTVLVTQNTKQFFGNFSEGSYWVFENHSDSTDIDTLKFIKKSSGTIPQYAEKCIDQYNEFIHYKMVSTISKDTLSASLNCNTNMDHFSLQGKYHNLQIGCSFTLVRNTSEIQVNTDFGDSLTIYNSYTIKNKTFNDVFKMKFTQLSRPHPEHAPVYLYSRNIGLIEFSVYDKGKASMKRYGLKDYLIK